MSDTTGITKEDAINAAQTIIEAVMEPARILLGYHNTFAFDTISRKLRLNDKEANIDTLGEHLTELLGEGDKNLLEGEQLDQLECHEKQITSFIDIRSHVVEIILSAKHIKDELENGCISYLE